MEKWIMRISYWLGVACVLIAVVWRLVNAMGYWLSTYMPGVTFNYNSAVKAGVLFLLTAIATQSYTASQKP